MSKRRRRLAIVLVLLFVFVLYPLSLGPGWLLVNHGYMPRVVFDVIYAPLRLVLEYCVPVREFIFTYYAPLWEPFLRRD